MGSGGVGGYFGARLVKGGADVHFVARGSHLAAMREHGLAVEGGPETIHLPKVNVTDDPETHRSGRHGDVLRQAVGHRGRGAPARLPIMKPETGVISFQNGVTKDDMLRPIFGDKALLGGVAYVGTSDRPARRDRADKARCSGWCSANTTAAARRGPRRSIEPASAAASMPSSATMFAARSGRNTSCWSPCRAPPPPCARPSDRSAAIRSRGHSCSISPARWWPSAAPTASTCPPTMPSSAFRSSTAGRPR